MVLETGTAFWRKTVVSSVVQILVYHVGILMSVLMMAGWISRAPLMLVIDAFIFVPFQYFFVLLLIQRTLVKRGRSAFIANMVVTMLLLILSRYLLNIRWLRQGGAPLPAELLLISDVRPLIFPMIGLEWITMACLMLGLYAMNTNFEGTPLGTILGALRGLKRMEPGDQKSLDPLMQRETPISTPNVAGLNVSKTVIITAAAAAVGFLYSVVLGGQSEFITGAVRVAIDLSREISSLSPALGSTLAMPEDPSILAPVILGLFRRYAIGSLAFGFFVNLSVSFYAGRIVGGEQKARKGISIQQFHLPENFIWPLIVSLSVVLGASLYLRGSGADASAIGVLDVAKVLAWNSAFVFLLLFAIQGYGIIAFYISRFRRPGRSNMLIYLLIFFGMFWIPWLGYLALVLGAGLGISEIWLKYRIKGKENRDHEDHP